MTTSLLCGRLNITVTATALVVFHFILNSANHAILLFWTPTAVFRNVTTVKRKTMSCRSALIVIVMIALRLLLNVVLVMKALC